MGFREAMLALLAESSKHGYQLKVDFEAATGDAWPVNIGQVYTTLQRLDRDEEVAIESTDDEGRVIYRITDRGEASLAEWMSHPVQREITSRDEVSMKVLMAVAAGVADPQRVIDVQRTATMAALQDYTRLRAQAEPDDLAWQLHVDRLAIQAEAELRWLDRVEARMERVDTSSPEPKNIDSQNQGQEVPS